MKRWFVWYITKMVSKTAILGLLGIMRSRNSFLLKSHIEDGGGSRIKMKLRN